MPGPRNDDGTPNFWFLGLDLTRNGYPCVPILPVDADIPAMGDAKKHAQALRSRGKAPGEYVGAPDLWRPMAGWQGGQLLQRGEIDCFRRWPGSPGVGIVLGRELPDGTVLAFVDADVRHPGAADDVRRLFEARLGAVPRRVGAAPKQGWLLRLRPAAGGVPSRLATPEFRMPGDADGDKAHRVEVLARGRQFVAFGIHPGTRRKYTWTDRTLTPLTVRAEDLPVVEEAALQRFLLDCSDILRRHGGVALAGLGRGPRAAAAKPREAYLARDPGLVAEAFRNLPNDDLPRDDWVAAAHALVGAFGKTAEALDLWLEFTFKAPKCSGDPASAMRVWDGIDERHVRSGAGSILRWAREQGWPPPHHPAPTGERGAALAAMAGRIDAWFDAAVAHGRARAEYRRRGERLAGRRDRERLRALLAATAGAGPDLPFEDGETPDRGRRDRARLARRLRAKVRARRGVDPRGEGPRLAVAAPAGIGKTRAVVGQLARRRPDLDGLTAWVMAPDHALAAQTHADLEAAGVPAALVRGRSAARPDDPGRTMCERAAVAEEVARAGVDVARLCEGCPRREACERDGYRSQATGRPGVYVLAHNYLTLPRAPAPAPDLVVVDERCWPTLVRHGELHPDAVTEPFPVDAAVLAPWTAVAAAVRAAATAPGALAACRAAGLGPDALRAAAAALGEARRRLAPQLSGAMPDRAVLERLARRGPAMRRAGLLRRLCLLLAAELPTGRDVANGVVFDPAAEVAVAAPDGGTRTEVQPRLSLHWTARPRLARRTPVLALDASADPGLARLVLGERAEVHACRLERNARVVQCRRAFGRHDLGVGHEPESRTPRQRELADEVAAFLRALQARHGRLLAVTYAGLDDELAAAVPGLEAMHFGRLRGRNAAEGCDAAVIVGREQPIAEAERQARALFHADPEPISALAVGSAAEMPRAWRGVRMREGGAEAMRVTVHPDPRVQLLLEQHREREVEQALDRLRLVHNAAPKTVYLLTGVVTDTTVDVLTGWPTLRAGGDPLARHLALEGLLPASPEALHRRRPEVWGSPRTAQRRLEASRALEERALPRGAARWLDLLGPDPAGDPAPWSPRLYLAEVRGGRGRPARVLVDRLRFATAEAVRAALAAGGREVAVAAVEGSAEEDAYAFAGWALRLARGLVASGDGAAVFGVEGRHLVLEGEPRIDLLAFAANEGGRHNRVLNRIWCAHGGDLPYGVSRPRLGGHPRKVGSTSTGKER